MMEKVGWAIAVAAVVTGLIRIVPIMTLSHRPFPAIFRCWLNFVPAAVLSAIIAVEILNKPQTTSFGVSVAFLSALATVITGMLTKSLFATVIASILAYLLFQNL